MSCQAVNLGPPRVATSRTAGTLKLRIQGNGRPSHSSASGVPIPVAIVASGVRNTTSYAGMIQRSVKMRPNRLRGDQWYIVYRTSRPAANTITMCYVTPASEIMGRPPKQEELLGSIRWEELNLWDGAPSPSLRSKRLRQQVLESTFPQPGMALCVINGQHVNLRFC